MTSRERVKVALRLEEPDKVPLACYAIDCDTVSRVLGRKTFIRDKAGQRLAYWEGRRDEIAESLKRDIPELFQKLDLYDVIHLRKIAIIPPRGYHPPAPKKIDDGVWEDERGRVYKYSEVTNEIVVVKDPTLWEHEYRLEDFPLDPEVEPEDESIYEVWDAVVDRLPPDRYVIGHFPMAREQILLGGYERGLVEVARNPEVVERAAASGRALARKQQQLWRRREFDGVMNENDFGHTTATFVSPDAFRRLFLPNIKFNAQAVHEAGFDFIQHSCGNNQPIFDQLVEADIDCLQSLQPQAGMTPEMVKERSDGRMAAWGGIDVAKLVAGTMEDVRREVHQAMETAKRGGGFLLGSSHSIAWGTKYDNFMAMLDEFQRTRDY
ncbi:MAG: uroporphyrinogen decarboxylase family protein [Armatimonadota bacterium]|nr:uroporphyrinogen decarboxylase family protein [Armatimonadota bacterium]